MSKEDSDEIVVHHNKCILCCRRLCASKFQNKSIRSRSAALNEIDLRKINMYSAIRGQWSNRLEFLLSCIGFTIGFGNIWRFPIKVYFGGGGAFLIPYIILNFSIGLPLLLLEMSLGQFSGRSPLKAFKLVPIMYGIGWCMFIISIIILIFYGVIMSWCYFYLFSSLNSVMPWTKCDNWFNTKYCLRPDVDINNINRTLEHVSSTSEYWDYYVSGFVKYPTRIRFTMLEDPGRPMWHLTLCLLLVWVVAGVILMFGNKVSGKVIYFSAIFPFIVIILLVALGGTLPGAYDGLMFFITPEWEKLTDPTIYIDVIEQIFFSIGIGIGTMITFSSFNGIRDNIYRDAIIIVCSDFIASMLAGIAVFEILGYMSFRQNVEISKIISSGPGLFFITFPEALATLPGANVWTFMTMLMAITLGMSTQFAMVQTLVTGMVDVCPAIRETKSSRGIFVIIVCFVFFLLGLLLCTPGGQFYFVLLDLQVISYGLPIIVLFETVAVTMIYGFKQFRYDCRMVMGFSLSWIWFFFMTFVAPLITIVIVLASLTEKKRIDISGETLPLLGQILSLILLLLVISPLFICAAHTVLLYKMKYSDLSPIELFKQLINPPVYWGPIYLKSWLLGRFYREKFLNNMKDPEMYKYAPDYQHLYAIALSAREAESLV